MPYSTQHKLLVISGAVFIAVGFTTFTSLGTSSFANGWDSYFYLIQGKSILTEGAMHSPSASLIHPYLTLALYCGMGEDLIAYKVAISILAGTFALITVLVAYKWSKREGVILVVGAFMVVSPFLDYIAAQYPKNLLGLVFFMAFLLSLSKEKLILPILFLALNFFGHKLTFGMAAIVFTCYYATMWLNKKVIFGSIILGFILVLLTLFTPGLLALADLERFSNFLSTTPSWASYEFASFAKAGQISRWWVTFVILIDIIFIACLAWLIYSKIRKKVINQHITPLVILGTIFLFPFLHWAEDGLALRMYLSFAILCPLLIIGLPITFRHPLIPAAIFILSIFFVRNTRGYSPKLQDPPYNTYATITDRLLVLEVFKNAELIIGHKSLAEYITFETGKDVLPWQPEYKVPDDKLWRIVTDVIQGDLRYYLGNRNFYQLSTNYYLVKESDWQNLLQKASDKDDQQFLKAVNTWRNPHMVRPNYLLRNKKE